MYYRPIKKFYFPVYLDFRGRTYYHGYPLNPQGDKMTRGLLLFGNQRKASLKKELDVSASGFQILGMLTYNINILEKTNFIQKKKSNLFVKKNDFYTNYLLKFQKLNPSTIVTDRKRFKNIVMCFFYNESFFGLFKKFQIWYPGSTSKDISNDVKSVRSFLEKEFIEFGFLKKLVTVVVDHTIKENIAIKYFSTEMISSHQYYGKQEVQRLNYYDRYNKRQKISIRQDVQPLSLDKSKTRRSTLPNFIHHIDSLLLH